MQQTIPIRLVTTQDLLMHDRTDASSQQEFVITTEESFNEVDASSPLKEAKFVEFVAVAGVVSVTWLINRITNHWLKKNEEGVQIDLRTNPATISTVANVPQGFVVVIDAEGKASLKQAEYEKTTDINTWLQETLQKTGANVGI